MALTACSDDANNSSVLNVSGQNKEEIFTETTRFDGKDMKLLKLDLPRFGKCFLHTPVVLPNLDTRKKDLNSEIYVPSDVFNIALNKPVASSEDFPLVGELKQATDGEKEAGQYVELGDGLQWIQIDLQKQAEIFAIVLWHRHDDYIAIKDVIIHLSDDQKFKKNVFSVFNNDHDNSAGFGVGTGMTWESTFEGRTFVLEKPVKARYIRLYSNGNTNNNTNSYVEVEVYGR
jgi:hypothetical protein